MLKPLKTIFTTSRPSSNTSNPSTIERRLYSHPVLYQGRSGMRWLQPWPSKSWCYSSNDCFCHHFSAPLLRCFRTFQIFECFKEIFLSYPHISLPTPHKEDEDQSLGCAIDQMFVSPPPKCMCWNLTPNVLAFGGRDFGMCLGHEGRALIIELVPLKKKPQRIT